MKLAADKGADAYFCGDIKHDRWIAAKNIGLSLYDCGHFHTEIIMVKYIADLLSHAFPDTEFIKSEKSVDIVEYEF